MDNKISTLGQLTGAAVVLATFQVTVWLLAPAQVIPVRLGLVTEKGPAAEAKVTETLSLWVVQPPPVALSLTVILKLILRLTLGKTSQVGFILAIKSGKRGKYLVGLVLGAKALKLGPIVAVLTGAWVLMPLSICSQE